MWFDENVDIQIFPAFENVTVDEYENCSLLDLVCYNVILR